MMMVSPTAATQAVADWLIQCSLDKIGVNEALSGLAERVPAVKRLIARLLLAHRRVIAAQWLLEQPQLEPGCARLAIDTLRWTDQAPALLGRTARTHGHARVRRHALEMLATREDLPTLWSLLE